MAYPTNGEAKRRAGRTGTGAAAEWGLSLRGRVWGGHCHLTFAEVPSGQQAIAAAAAYTAKSRSVW